MRRLPSSLMLAFMMACGGADAAPHGSGPADEEPRDSDAEGDADRCIDADGDGFGRRCEDGSDCDDHDDTVFEDCAVCFAVEAGCGCEANAPPVECDLSAKQLSEDRTLCKTGMRYCRDSRWTACIGVAQLTP